MKESVDILLVEDNPTDVELALHAFKKYNIANSILVARDGLEALEYLFGLGQYKERNVADLPKVVLLDLKLPKVDGLEVLRRLRSDQRTRMVPVVVLTSSHEEKDVAQSYNLGINSYIVKPVDFGKFTEVVRELGFYWLFLNQPPVKRAGTQEKS